MRLVISRNVRRAGALTAMAFILAAGATAMSGAKTALSTSPALQVKASDSAMVWNAILVVTQFGPPATAA